MMGKCDIDVTQRKKGSESDVRADSSTWTVLHNYHGYVRKWRLHRHGHWIAQSTDPRTRKNLLQLVYYFISNPKERGRQGEAQTAGPGVQVLVSFEISKIDVITFQVLGTLNHSVGANSIYVI